MTCPCGLTEDFDCPECVADMDQPLCYLDPMIDEVRYGRSLSEHFPNNYEREYL